MKQIVWGIIGCGDVTEVKSGPAFSRVPNSLLAAVMRRDATKAEDYAKRHQVRKWYSDADALINDKEINAIYVATPPAFHEEYTLAAFKAGKSVYVEKPMAMDSSGCFRMMEAAEKYSCKLSIAHYRRAQPKFLEIRRLIKQKAIGDILSAELEFMQTPQAGIENTWRTDPKISGGGLFHDLAPHQLDLMVYLFGNPESAIGISSNRTGHYAADDFVSGEIIFENQVKFKGVWDFSTTPENEIDQCEITGTNGTLRFAVFGDKCELTVDGKITDLVFDHLPHVQQPMIGQVVNYFLGKGSNPCSASEAVIVMEMMDKITGKINEQMSK